MSVLKNPDPYKRTGSAWSGPKRVSGQSELEKIYGVPSSHGVQKAGGGNAGTTMNAGNQQLMDAYGAGNPVIAGGGTSGTQASTTPTVGSSKAPTPTTAGGTTVNTGNQQLLEAYGREETPSAAKVAYDTGMTELQRTYDSGVKKQEQIRSDSRREASIAYDRMSKYLPRAQMAMGTAGTGMAESDRIAAYNHYTGRLADANRVYADKVAELDEARAAGETELQRVYARQQETEQKEKDNRTLDVYKGMMDDALASGGRLTQAEYDAIVEKGKSMGLSDSAIETMLLLNETYGRKITPDGVLTEAEKATNSGNLYNEFFSKCGLMVGEDDKISQSDYAELQAWYQEHEGELTELDKQSVQRQLDDLKDYVYTDEEQTKNDREAQIEKDGGAVRADFALSGDMPGFGGNNITVVDGVGSVYSVQIGGKATDEAVLNIAKTIVEDGEIFGYGDAIYLSKNGTAYKIEPRDTDWALGENGGGYRRLMERLKKIQSGEIKIMGGPSTGGISVSEDKASAYVDMKTNAAGNPARKSTRPIYEVINRIK